MLFITIFMGLLMIFEIGAGIYMYLAHGEIFLLAAAVGINAIAAILLGVLWAIYLREKRQAGGQ